MVLSREEACMGKTYLFRGKRYSTDSATKCGSFGSRTIYKKRTGECFIYDSETDKIRPIKYETAKELAEKYIPDAEKFFKGSGTKKVTSFSLSTESIEKMKELAVKLDCSSSQIIEDAVREMYKTIIG